jgi:hypothetical protein
LLELEWDALNAWDRSRARLVKVAIERRRQPSSTGPEIRRDGLALGGEIALLVTLALGEIPVVVFEGTLDPAGPPSRSPMGRVVLASKVSPFGAGPGATPSPPGLLVAKRNYPTREPRLLPDRATVRLLHTRDPRTWGIRPDPGKVVAPAARQTPGGPAAEE